MCERASCVCREQRGGPGLVSQVSGTEGKVTLLWSWQLLVTRCEDRRGTALRNGPSRRGAFPAFLALGRPGPAQSHRGMPPSGPFQRLSNSAGVGEKRRQGQEMWQKALDKGSHGKAALALPINPKDTSKQSCAAVPFAQRVSAAGCEAVTVQNKLCFGQCSSLYVPPGGDSMADAGISSLCSRCGPSKVRSVTVPLRCRGSEVRERRVTLVEECKCETGSEEDSGEKMRRRGGQM
ncbi:hypothetical protein AAFF_G00290450 [Aldrovandia affinis]|uniref:CTCK domain-containing protein n=1 Tax=Aldrovandia affinis TaxID=143900 RepID=A0AAD7RA38_9TELE|nr:hypothetical protein AAFF_G00290450 [Aldrovandia affinis]